MRVVSKRAYVFLLRAVLVDDAVLWSTDSGLFEETVSDEAALAGTAFDGRCRKALNSLRSAPGQIDGYVHLLRVQEPELCSSRRGKSSAVSGLPARVE